MWFTARWTSAQEISSLWKHLFRAGHSGRNIFAGKTLGTFQGKFGKILCFLFWMNGQFKKCIQVFRYSTLDESYGIMDTQDMPFASCMSVVCLLSLICGFALVMNASGPVVASKTQLLDPGYVVKKELPGASPLAIEVCKSALHVLRSLGTPVFSSVWAWSNRFPGFGWRDVVECERLASHNILCGSWMIMVDQHPTNGLLGRKTESLLDSSLDKFHEAVKFQEKKADLSFGPQTK